MKQFQIDKTKFNNTRIVERDGDLAISDDEILVRVERFGFSANNITYAAAGETIGYWKFFMPVEGEREQWGVLPVWGFAEIVRSNVEDLPVGERLFGYFPPASHLVMVPQDIKTGHFFDGAEHRSELPKGYNVYRRVGAEPGYDKKNDNVRMLLYPLYITAFALWDVLKENDWYGAEQIVIVSASSKTSIGLAYALAADGDAPQVTGITSSRNLKFVESLNIYNSAVTYDEIATKLEAKPTVIVDMSGNSEFLGSMHAHLADNMIKTVNVGLTHWENFKPNENIIKERSAFFFAPSQIQKRMKEWGAEEFDKRSQCFFVETTQKSSAWLELTPIKGIEGLSDIFINVLNGELEPHIGLIIENQ